MPFNISFLSGICRMNNRISFHPSTGVKIYPTVFSCKDDDRKRKSRCIFYKPCQINKPRRILRISNLLNHNFRNVGDEMLTLKTTTEKKNISSYSHLQDTKLLQKGDKFTTCNLSGESILLFIANKGRRNQWSNSFSALHQPFAK